MNEWSHRRKQVIFLITFLSLLILIGVPSYLVLHKTPTCSDGLMNGDENGVDCGGSCVLICSADSLPLLTNGDPRVLELSQGNYTAVVHVENPNIFGEVKRAGYTFKIYERESVTPLKIIEGETFVPKGQSFAIFEGPFSLGDRVPARVTFDWKDETLVWKRNTENSPRLIVEDVTLLRENTEPRLVGTITNESLERVSNIELVALLYSIEGNIIATSKTVVETLQSRESASVVFTWPAPFTASSTSSVILPRVLPDKTYIR